MTLTEEQRDALDFALECLVDDPNDDRDSNLANCIRTIRAMIDSSGAVGFDLEARATNELQKIAIVLAEKNVFIKKQDAEIERLRAENLELQVAMIGPDGIRAHQACIIADQAARIKELEADNQNLVTLNKSLMNNDWILRDNNRKYRKRALKAELLNKELNGKIGPDADFKPHCWQITEGRKMAISVALAHSPNWPNDLEKECLAIEVLRDMLTEVGQ